MGHFFPLACRRMLVSRKDLIMFACLQLWLEKLQPEILVVEGEFISQPKH